ncbi:MAG: aldehyde dehydrogenase family protein, partial [Myxococcota bacterium]
MALEALAPGTRNLIDGALVDASNGNTFENVNPATEEVIGVAADGTKDDMLSAVAAARRAFDESDWSENPDLRARCLRQLYEGFLEEKEQFRAITVAEAGSPVTLSPFMQVDDPIEMMSY